MTNIWEFLSLRNETKFDHIWHGTSTAGKIEEISELVSSRLGKVELHFSFPLYLVVAALFLVFLRGELTIDLESIKE